MASLEQQLAAEQFARIQAEARLATLEKQLTIQRQTLELALWASQESIWEWSPPQDLFQVTGFNREREKLAFSGGLGQFLAQIHPDDIHLLKHQIDKHSRDETDLIEVSFRYFSQTQWQWLRIRGQTTERDSTGAPLKIVGTLKDISAQQSQLERLNTLAKYDSLTGLLNRRTLLSELHKWTHQQLPFCLLFVDLDGFKQLNDVAGHHKGDEFLQQVASTLRAELPSNALIGRYGGDEFVCVIPQTHWQQYVQRLVEVRTPFELSSSDTMRRVTGSIGVALYPEHSADIDELLEFADAAMFLAKQQGKNNYVLYQPALFAEKRQRESMLHALVQALAQESLEFYLQPKFDAAEQVRGAELLCRWHHPVFGQVPPAVFVPLIEENNLAMQLAVLALKNAAIYQRALADNGLHLLLAVNISAALILSTEFVSAASQIFDDYAVQKQSIELEVTESVFIQDSGEADRCLERLQEHGFRVAMDDFGTGYSSLSYVSRYHFDTIKIDQSFVKDMLLFTKARLLVEGIISLCHTLDMNIVAEGVETREQLVFLKKLGVQRFQGYLLSKPIPFTEFMRKFAAKT